MKKKVIASAIGFLLIAFGAVGMVQARESEVIDPVPKSEPVFIPLDKETHSLIAVSNMFMLPVSDDKELWIKSVCVGMTQGGCQYFRDNQAEKLWNVAFRSGGIGGYVVNETPINDTASLWQINLTVYNEGSEREATVFALVELGADNKWRLNRVLYGPGISQ